MYVSALGLLLDIFGAVLLIQQELLAAAAFVNYRATGEQRDNYIDGLRKFPWWKRWPLEFAGRIGTSRHLGQEAVEDSFPVKLWGFLLLVIGFAFQALGALFAC